MGRRGDVASFAVFDPALSGEVDMDGEVFVDPVVWLFALPEPSSCSGPITDLDPG